MTKQNLKKVINQIKKLAEEVYGELGSGFDERVYQKAMEVGLRLAGGKRMVVEVCDDLCWEVGFVERPGGYTS